MNTPPLLNRNAERVSGIRGQRSVMKLPLHSEPRKCPILVLVGSVACGHFQKSIRCPRIRGVVLLAPVPPVDFVVMDVAECDKIIDRVLAAILVSDVV